MESAVRVIAAPEELVVMVAADVARLIPVLLPAPPVPVTETVPVPPALISPLFKT